MCELSVAWEDTSELRAFNCVYGLRYILCRMSKAATDGRSMIDCLYVPFLSSIVSVLVVSDLLSDGLVFCLPVLSVCAAVCAVCV